MLLEQIVLQPELGQGPDTWARFAIARVDAPNRSAARAGCVELEDGLLNAIQSTSPIQVSRSHSGEWIAVGAAAGVAIGVDIERMRPRQNRSRMAQYIGLGPGAADSNRTFFAHWTLREALAKCTGGSVLCSPENEDALRAATRTPGTPVSCAGMAALCGRYGDDIYYALVLHSSALGALIPCT